MAEACAANEGQSQLRALIRSVRDMVALRMPGAMESSHASGAESASATSTEMGHAAMLHSLKENYRQSREALNDAMQKLASAEVADGVMMDVQQGDYVVLGRAVTCCFQTLP